MKHPRPLLTDLLPGDVLLYAPQGFFGWITAVKTWSKTAGHVETYVGNGCSVASRNGIGVNTYPVRLSGLTYVRRPVAEFNLNAAMAWHRTVIGQKYDWLGLLVFYLAVKKGAKDKMFCSEHTTRFQRKGGIHPFDDAYDADRVPPVDFLVSDSYDTFWSFK